LCDFAHIDRAKVLLPAFYWACRTNSWRSSFSEWFWTAACVTLQQSLPRRFRCVAPAQPPPPNYAGHHAADINVVMSCGGVAVHPGDIVFADAEAVFVIPFHLAEEGKRPAIPFLNLAA